MKILLFFLWIVPFILTEHLSQKVLDLLQIDTATLETYREDHLFLTCKLLTLSNVRYYYEEKMIDTYIRNVTNRLDFLKGLEEKMMNMCIKENSSTNELFEENLHYGYNKNLFKLTNVSLSEYYTNYTLNNTVHVKEKEEL